jgi:hypothetical protein
MSSGGLLVADAKLVVDPDRFRLRRRVQLNYLDDVIGDDPGSAAQLDDFVASARADDSSVPPPSCPRPSETA